MPVFVKSQHSLSFKNREKLGSRYKIDTNSIYPFRFFSSVIKRVNSSML